MELDKMTIAEKIDLLSETQISYIKGYIDGALAGNQAEENSVPAKNGKKGNKRKHTVIKEERP
jgi:hypothetical protein